MKKYYWLAFLITIVITLGYASFTDHRWEDWYITFRASKNLAIGEGLTFTKGERVYSYTSPINTLLPSAFVWLFRSNSDEIAIWLYRLVNTLVLGACSIFLLKFAQLFKFNHFNTIFLVSLFVFSSLIIDFSINGMEAPYMMLFLLLLIYNLAKKENASISLFVTAFTGLMYTRPDGFVYAGSLLLGCLLFYTDFKNPKAGFPFWRKIIIAGLISTVLYAPWILWTWWYYGSPIPNTVLAKANLKQYNIISLCKLFVVYPYYLITGGTFAGDIFMPAYARIGGWNQFSGISHVVSVTALLAFIIPFVPPLIRAVSLSAYLGVFYLTYVSGQGGAPWYLPNITIQAILVLSSLSYAISFRYKWKWIPVVSMIFILFNVVVFSFAAYEFKVQQQVIEFGNRKVIGEWLKVNAENEKSTVFLECLGYIGYYSQLKTYDYPGMSSPEVVKTLKEMKLNKVELSYAGVIKKLEPDWLVLRPFEITKLNKDAPELLQNNYILAKVFDVSNQIPQKWYLLGKQYLYVDAFFTVYKRR